jgi:D-glycero-D-manno-heptose 1,7-bisphosphate phosphatase
MVLNRANMPGKAIFFDRDNTLIVASDYVGDASKVKVMPGAADAVARARELGFRTIVISNQSGVARGMFTEDDVAAVNRRIETLLMLDRPEARIDRHEYCPFHPEGTVEAYRQDSEFRKPKPGMILKAARELDIDLASSWVIGDAPRDIAAGKAAGCRTILLKPQDVPQSPAADEPLNEPPDATVATLDEAMQVIERDVGHHLPDSDNGQTMIEARTTRAGGASDRANVVSQPPQSQSDAQSQSPLPFATPTDRVERLLERIAREIGRSRHEHATDFSVTRLLAGILQVVSLATMFLAYLNRGEPSVLAILLTAIFFQLLTLTLILMNRTGA